MIGPQHAGMDVFYTLPAALDIKSGFLEATIERDACTIDLISDVHRDHGIRNAILAVVPSAGIDDFVRIAIAHAWREGVRNWILLLCDKHAPGGEADAFEQELRVLLDAVGDGGGAPCIRSALTRYIGSIDSATKFQMARLAGEIERVFVRDEPAGAMAGAALPERFAREAAILDAVRPAIRAATRFDQRGAVVEETVERIRSQTGGWPYRPADEAAPLCPSCGADMYCFLQLDMRDMVHAIPPAHRLFVVYRCHHCYQNNTVTRHYAATTERALYTHSEIDDAQILCNFTLCHMLPREVDLEQHADVIEALRRIDENWGKLYWWTEKAMGMRSLRIPDHVGGWVSGQMRTNQPLCRVCKAELNLLVTMAPGDWSNSVWACAEHPDVTYYEHHK